MGVDGTWDEQVVKRIFWPMDAELILTIRLSARAEEDFLAWHPDKWGVFSVRSAYKLALQLAAIDNGSGSSEAETSKAWNLVWKCNVPQKVKVFTWRAATNSLATMENKNKRKLEATGTCGICGVEAEDVAHALCRCPQAKKMWDAMQVAGKGAKDIVGNCTRADWILYQLKIMPREQHAMFLMVLWRIWYVRN
jgi:beta-lactamase class D